MHQIGDLAKELMENIKGNTKMDSKGHFLQKPVFIYPSEIWPSEIPPLLVLTRKRCTVQQPGALCLAL